MQRQAAMMMMIGAALGAAACTTPSAEDATVEESQLGTRPGSGLSSPNVDPAATYLSSRSLGVLESVGALDAAQMAVARRADGIIANTPADGRVSVDELVRLEGTNVLFPAERAQLPAVWNVMRLDPVTAGLAPPASSTNEEVEDLATRPPPLDETLLKLPIANVEPARSLSAQRVELTFDDDHDPSTISIPDVDGALARQASYLPAEVEDFRAIRVLIQEAARRVPAKMSARARVPTPGTFRRQVAPDGTAFGLEVVRQVAIVEHRWIGDAPHTTLHLNREGWFAISGASQLKIVVIRASDAIDSIVNDGGNVPADGAPLLFEAWKGGRRVATVAASEPAIPRGSVDLGAFVGFQLLAGNTPLHRNVVHSVWTDATRTRPSMPRDVTYSFDTTAGPTPDPAYQRLEQTASLPPGEYETMVGFSPAIVDIYPEGAVRVLYKGAMKTLLPGEGQTLALQWSVTSGPPDSYGFCYLSPGDLTWGQLGVSILHGPLTLLHRKG